MRPGPGKDREQIVRAKSSDGEFRQNPEGGALSPSDCEAAPVSDWRDRRPKTGAAIGCGINRRMVPAFTLLEVLIALAIFAMAAVVLGATYVNALNAYEMVGRRNEYDADLQFVRAAALTEPDRKKVEEGGDLDLGGNKHAHWQADIASTESVDLFSVTWTCEITDPARHEPYRTKQTFLLLRPTWSDPVERSALMDQVKQRILELQGAVP
jgi:general secretion pathway protein I